MNKNLLVVLVVGIMFFVTGCACCKSKMKKSCPMESMKHEEMVMPAAAPAVAEATAPAVEATQPAAEAVQQNAEAPVAK